MLLQLVSGLATKRLTAAVFAASYSIPSECKPFCDKHPEIEQCYVANKAGKAAEGCKPVCAIWDAFGQCARCAIDIGACYLQAKKVCGKV